jgi:hypothetical protein
MHTLIAGISDMPELLLCMDGSVEMEALLLVLERHLRLFQQRIADLAFQCL